jgi:hypothetical protein
MTNSTGIPKPSRYPKEHPCSICGKVGCVSIEAVLDLVHTSLQAAELSGLKPELEVGKYYLCLNGGVTEIIQVHISTLLGTRFLGRTPGGMQVSFNSRGKAEPMSHSINWYGTLILRHYNKSAKTSMEDK